MPVSEDLLFDVDAISTALEARDHDVSRLSVPFVARPSGLGELLLALIAAWAVVGRCCLL
jgi:hypothetical protein